MTHAEEGVRPLAALPRYAERLRERLAGVYTRNPGRPGDRRAAVLLPLIGDPASLVGILRVDDGGTHGGQFALPGGVREPQESSWECASREAREELGLEVVPEPLGELGEFNTHVSRFRVRAHVAYLAEAPRWRPQIDEVAAIFAIPMDSLVPCFLKMATVHDVWELPLDQGFEPDLAAWRVAGQMPPRGRRCGLTTRAGPVDVPTVWGLTARILYDFLRLVWLPATKPR